MNYPIFTNCHGLWGGEGSIASLDRKFRTESKAVHRGECNTRRQASTIVTEKGNFLTVKCFLSADTRLLRKEESGPLGRSAWDYAFDNKGHLCAARKNGHIVERYAYDEGGRRVSDHLAWLGVPRQFIYYYDGSLIRVDDEYLSWTEKGQLNAVYDRARRCEFHYGQDTRLENVLLPSGMAVGYEYGQGPMPVRVTENGEPVAEYEWENALRLSRSVDIRAGVVYTFSYGENRAPVAVTITGRPDAVGAVTGVFRDRFRLYVGVDQVDSVRVLATADGQPVKCVEYDSFGNVTRDTRPGLRFPLGFACGLKDPYTGFVRFGFRDYHPLIGRFTTRDPAGDTGGDNDLWDYCVDDPVSRIDPSGLWTQGTFDESKVARDGEGRFTATGGGGNGGIGRQIGLGTAAVIDGMADNADFLAAPFRHGLNAINGVLGGDPEYVKPLGKTVTEKLGLPEPRTERERFNYGLQQGVASILSAGALAGTSAGGQIAGIRRAGLGQPAYPTMAATARDIARKGAELPYKAAAGLAARNLDKRAQYTAEFLEGALVPVSPSLSTPVSALGAVAKQLYDER